MLLPSCLTIRVVQLDISLTRPVIRCQLLSIEHALIEDYYETLKGIFMILFYFLIQGDEEMTQQTLPPLYGVGDSVIFDQVMIILKLHCTSTILKFGTYFTYKIMLV